MRRRLLLSFQVLAAALMVLCGYAAARAAPEQTKVALVIGNSRYTSPSVPALDTPANDAQDVADALMKIGFKVILKTDVTKGDFDSALEEFDRAASTSDIALFYFAGHGVQYKGENYFIPVDILPKDGASIKYKSIAMNDVVDAASQARNVKIIVLDACRNSVPDRVAARSRSVTGLGDASGLAPINGADGMIVFYSTEPGKVALDSNGQGRNSPFAQAFLSHILEPGRDIQKVFKEVSNDVKIATREQQHPAEFGELTSDVFLNPAETAEEVWKRIRNSTDPAIFKQFIKDFPNSELADAAQLKLDKFDSDHHAQEDERARKEAEAKASAAAEAIAALQKREQDAKAAQQAQLEKEKADKEAAARALADEQAQMAAAKKREEEKAAEEKRKAAEAAAAAAAEQARMAKEKADKEAEAKRLAEEAAAAKKILSDEADAARKIADREAVEKASRAAEQEAEGERKLEAAKQQAAAEEEARKKAAAEAAALEAAEKAKRAAEEEAEAARKLEAAKQQAKAEEEAREKEVAAAAAKATAEACSREQAEIARLKDTGQTDAIQVLKSQSVCPAVVAAADQAIKDIIAIRAKVCADDQKRWSRIDPKDESALKAALDTLTCDAVRESASKQIGKLVLERLRVEQVCADERAGFAAVDLFVRTARDDLSTLQAKSQCASLRPDLASAISDIDKRVTSAQEELQRLGCYRVKPVSGRFDQSTVKALTDYLTARHASDANSPKITEGLVDELKGQDFQVCSVPAPAQSPSSPGVVTQPLPKRVLARPPILIKPNKYEAPSYAAPIQPRKVAAEKPRASSPVAPRAAAPRPAVSAPSPIIGTTF